MIRRIAQAVGYALSGLTIAWREEAGFKIDVVCAILVGGLGLYLHLSSLEFVIIILTISCVLAGEAFNTAIEELCDKVEPAHDPHIAKVKDLASGAVLVTGVGAFCIGVIIFIPHLWLL